MEDEQNSDPTGDPTSWAILLDAYRTGPRERWSGLLLERLGPWLTVAKRHLRAVPPYLDSDDVSQQLAFEVLRIAARWRPGCEDRWIPRRLVERAARRVNKALLREQFAGAEELGDDLASGDLAETDHVFETPIGKATASDLKVIFRAKVLGEPIEVLAREAGVTSEVMRRRLRAARRRAKANARSGSRG